MAVIDSPTTSNAATIHATVKAVRATEYCNKGIELSAPVLPTTMYILDAHTSYGSIIAFSASTYLFAICVASTATKSVYIRKLSLLTNFTGTGAASSAQYAVHLFYATAVSDTSGGGGSTMKYKTSYASPQAAVVVGEGAGASVTITTERQLVLANLQSPRRVGSSMVLDINFINKCTPKGLYLNPYMTMGATKYAGIGVQILNSSVAGDYINMIGEWGEYA